MQAAPAPSGGALAGLLATAKGVSAPAVAAAPTVKAPASSNLGTLLATAKGPAAPAASTTPAAPAPEPQITAPLFGAQPKVNTAQPFSEGSSQPILDATGKALGGSNIGAALSQAPASQSINPQDWLKAGADQLGSSIQKAGDDLDTAVSTIQDQHASALGKGVAAGQAGMSALNSLFSIVTVPLTVISKVPGVGYLADAANNLFGAIGAGGQDAAQAALEKMPLSDDTKAKLNPLVGELGALAAQLIAGKGGDEAIPAIADKTRTVLQTISDNASAEDLAKDPNVQAHIAQQTQADPLNAAKQLPVKEVPDAIFPKSSANPDVKVTNNESAMHPDLRSEIRDNLTQHGPVATHAALQEEMGMTKAQADAHLREAPVPQNADEEITAHQSAMRQVLLKAPEDRAALAEPKQATSLLPRGKEGATIQGEGFTATDKVDKDKVATTKSINDYRDAVAKFNKNPTPKGLATVRTARAAMDDALTPKEAAAEVVKAPKTKTVKAPVDKPVLEEKPSKTAPKAEKASVSEPAAPTINRPVADDGTRVTKAANDINEGLVKKGLDQLPEELQSKYTSGSYKDSVAKVTEMMGTDMESVKSMAKSGEGIPEGVHPQILFNAVEAYATKNADVGLLRDLASSPLGTKLSEAGGELGSHGFNDNPNSAISKIREVSKARDDAFTKTNQGKSAADEVKSTAADLKAVRKASAPKIKDWNTFIKSLQC